jgi:hypothetical protein
VYLGTNASILPDVKVGPWATIGANSAVIQNVPTGATVMGVPAQVLIPGSAMGGLEGVANQPVTPEAASSPPVQVGVEPPSAVKVSSPALAKLQLAQQKLIRAQRAA